jgi:hypothetical protein
VPDILRFSIAAVLAVACGWPIVRAARSAIPAGVFCRLALSFAIGLALLSPLLLLSGAIGLPFRGRTFIVEAILAALLLRRIAPDPEWPALAPPAGERGWLRGASLALYLAALALFAAKVVRFPLWSWDHWAVWGVRSRRMVTDGYLDLTFLNLPAYDFDYPLGMAVVWRFLGLGSLPGCFFVKATHVLLAFALAALVDRAVAAETGSRVWGHLAAALLALSPLYWDTEAVGHMDLPLAFFATAALWLVILALRSETPARPLALAGLMLGFLPWIKTREGLTFEVLVVAAAIVLFALRLGRRSVGPLAALLPGLLVLAGGALLVQQGLPRGEHFAGGNWWERFNGRLPEGGRILGLLARCLVSPEWLGFWLLFFVATVYFMARRHIAPAVLSLVVWLQLSVYGSVYFVTFLDWHEHLRGSFCRISAALLPLGILAASAGWRERA